MSGGVVCSYCNKRGHIAPNCFLKARHRENQMVRNSYPSNPGYHHDSGRNEEYRHPRGQGQGYHQMRHPHPSHPSTPERYSGLQPYHDVPLEQHQHFRNLSPSLLSRLSITPTPSSSEGSLPSPPNSREKGESSPNPVSRSPSLQGDDSPPHIGPIRHFGSRSHKSGNQIRNVQSALAPAKAVFMKSVSAAVSERGDDLNDASVGKSSPRSAQLNASFGEDLSSSTPLPKSLSFYMPKEDGKQSEGAEAKKNEEESSDKKFPSKSESRVQSTPSPQSEFPTKPKRIEWGLEADDEEEANGAADVPTNEEPQSNIESSGEKGSAGKEDSGGWRGKGSKNRGRGRGRGGTKGKGAKNSFTDSGKWSNNSLAPIKTDAKTEESKDGSGRPTSPKLLELQLQNMLLQAAEEKAERQRLERQLKHREEQIAFLELQLRASLSIHDEHDEPHDSEYHDQEHYDLEYHEEYHHPYPLTSADLSPSTHLESPSQSADATHQINASQTTHGDVDSDSLNPSAPANDLSVH